MTNSTLAVYLMLQPSPPAMDSAFLIPSAIVTWRWPWASIERFLTATCFRCQRPSTHLSAFEEDVGTSCRSLSG